MYERPTTRTYTYRVPLDDSRAMRKINRLQSLDTGYSIHKLHNSNVDTHGNGRHFGMVFYESTERIVDGDKQGGTIPGLHKYRYSLDWQNFPGRGRLEMRHANGGGTRIKGDVYVGTSDPRLPNRIPIDTGVPWTPTEIEAMYNDEPVPNKDDYSHDPPEIPGEEAVEKIQQTLHWAEEEGFEQVRSELHEMISNCDHDHVVNNEGRRDTYYCEDCGREWQAREWEHGENGADRGTVVGVTQ